MKTGTFSILCHSLIGIWTGTSFLGHVIHNIRRFWLKSASKKNCNDFLPRGMSLNRPFSITGTNTCSRRIASLRGEWGMKYHDPSLCILILGYVSLFETTSTVPGANNISGADQHRSQAAEDHRCCTGIRNIQALYVPSSALLRQLSSGDAATIYIFSRS